MRPSSARGTRSLRLWLGALAVAAFGLSGCQELEPSDQPPVLTSVGPVTGADGAVRVAYSVYDAQGEAVRVSVQACHDGESCVGGGCLALRGIEGGQPLSVRGDDGPEATVRTLRWWPGCEGDALDLELPFVLCLTPDGGDAVTTPWMLLYNLGVPQAGAPCPASIGLEPAPERW